MNEEIIKQEANYDFLKDEVHCLYEEKKELQQRINKAIKKLSSAVNHFKTQRDNNVITLTLKILKGGDSDE